MIIQAIDPVVAEPVSHPVSKTYADLMRRDDVDIMASDFAGLPGAAGMAIAQSIGSGQTLYTASFADVLGEQEAREARRELQELGIEVIEQLALSYPEAADLALPIKTTMALDDLQTAATQNDEFELLIAAGKWATSLTTLLNALAGMNPAAADQVKAINLLISVGETVYKVAIGVKRVPD